MIPNRHRSAVRAAASALVLLSLMLPHVVSAQKISYTLAMPEPWTHCFLVTLQLEGLDDAAESVDLQMPVWRPGRYRVFDFAGGVVRFSAATPDGKAIRWEKMDKSTWRIEKGSL